MQLKSNQDKQKEKVRESVIQTIQEIKRNGNFGDFMSYILSLESTEMGVEAYKNYRDAIPPELVWSALMMVYIRLGFNFPADLIIKELPFRPTDYLSKLHPKFKDGHDLTIYRASSIVPTPQNSSPLYEISWTTDPAYAREFYEMRIDQGLPAYFYQANININDAFDFLPRPHSARVEVLQYGKVTNIKELSMSEVDTICKQEVQHRKDEQQAGMQIVRNYVMKAIEYIKKEGTIEEFLTFLKDLSDSNSVNCEANENIALEAYIAGKDMIPNDETRWYILLYIYGFLGSGFPIELIREVLPYRPKNYLDALPAEYRDDEILTVYRASYPSDKVNPRFKISWSLNPKVAMVFYYMYLERSKIGHIDYKLKTPNVYKATIKKSDIMAYRDGAIMEILQYDSVSNIQKLSDSEMDRECELYERVKEVQSIFTR